ncbi:cytidine deaminase [Heterostelium album PN500]|uniref:Cytidine deaminase n=1 Tax=Heterostelium pallidum (strain ATCC 26659 / Pp 5 / PN500) TaxID=670386 RepID=D3B4F8_HETP5|nr:cytidine deaminase [Heterostelium album PN500]EFA84206.1 cytidine deaminase [Heterostelium album PN500]|eukprot:XP_020436322.1 cytidine deaminase [Heterostelium album PN500]
MATQEQLNKLFEVANEAKKRAYCKYSNFRVGAALLCEDGTIISGCNVENGSYGLTICAERTAYTKAISEGHTKFKTIVVTTDVEDRFITPCGACRQFGIEFGNFDVYCVKPDLKSFFKSTTSDLLPGSFTPADLDAPRTNN